ncbi:MAG TPA: membrane protein insertase YidC [Gammaproteobacteria bacterium]|nr:membrane protein insertase YidC [Gammaproteobacteria bacterium]
MDNQRLFLFVGLSFVMLLLWQAWMEDYGPVPPAEIPVAETGQLADIPAGMPAEIQADTSDLPSASADMVARESVLPETALLETAQYIDVETDLFHIRIDTTGGDLRQADLLAYPATMEPDSPPFRLLNDSLPNLFVVQSGLRASVGTEPTHHVVYTPEQTSYRMAESADELVVPMTWHSPEGVEVTKRYVFHRGSYAIDLQHEVRNHSGADWHGRQYRQLQRTQVAETGQSTFIYTYMGGVIYSPEEKYEKIKFDDMAEENLDRTITDGWAAMLQHYFLGALIPAGGEADRYYTNTLSNARYVIGMIAPNRVVADGSSALYETRLFIGPKLQDEMKAVAPGLELTVDYGLLTVLAQPVFWLLKTIHKLVGNWGWSIIFVTMLIKLAFYKLSETSYKSMANMRKLAPRMKSLKERYGDDRQKLNQAMMEMYKKEKINPLGGCLPIVVQIPVFISLYWVLLESVELRQAPFALWITDMSSPDPYYILPLLMGVTMLIQQKLNPAPMDPIQAKIMMILPVVFTVFFAFFPSGLVLYWVVNNTLSIAQQWVITRRVERGGK